jgi:hypothetical protein
MVVGSDSAVKSATRGRTSAGSANAAAAALRLREMEDTPEPAHRRWSAGRRLWTGDPVVRAMVAVYPLIRLLGVITAAPVNAPDAAGYRVRGDNFLNFSLTSLDGHSIRPWGVTIWMALWPSDRGILLAQAALSVVAWAALAVTVANGIENPAWRRVMAFVVLLVSCTAQVMALDANMLSESVSVSTGVLALVAIIRFTRQPSWTRAGVLVLFALWFAMTRPNVFPVLLAWAVALAVVGVLRRQVVLCGAVAGAFVLTSLYAFVYNVRSDDTWRAEMGVTRTTIAYAYPIAGNNPVAEDVLADVRKSDAPRCMIPATPGDVSRHGTTRWVHTTAAVCPGMDAWATDNWTRWWAGWLLDHPRKMWTIIHTELPNALSPPANANVSAPAPTFVSSMFFGSTSIPQSAVTTRSYRTQPLLLWLGAIITLAVLTRRRLRGGSWHTDLVVLFGAAGALVSAISGGLLIQAAPDGVGRENAGVAMLLTASCIALVGLGLGRLSSTSPDRQDPEPAPALEVTPTPPVATDVHPARDAAEEVAADMPRQDHPVR